MEEEKGADGGDNKIESLVSVNNHESRCENGQ